MSQTIRFTRNGSTLKAVVTILNGVSFEFLYDARYEWAAMLLFDAISLSYRAAVSSAQCSAYARGWKDAKAKRKKNTYFDGFLP